MHFSAISVERTQCFAGAQCKHWPVQPGVKAVMGKSAGQESARRRVLGFQRHAARHTVAARPLYTVVRQTYYTQQYGILHTAVRYTKQQYNIL